MTCNNTVFWYNTMISFLCLCTHVSHAKEQLVVHSIGSQPVINIIQNIRRRHIVIGFDGCRLRCGETRRSRKPLSCEGRQDFEYAFAFLPQLGCLISDVDDRATPDSHISFRNSRFTSANTLMGRTHAMLDISPPTLRVSP